MDINQKILKDKNIIETIKNLILDSSYKFNYKTVYPKKIDWYKNIIKILQKIIQENNDKFKSLIYYKRSGYMELNRILINKSFPLIYI